MAFFFENQGENQFNYLLENFSGPLDLLLETIKEAKIDIKDVFISHVTAQYLEHIRQMEMDLEDVTEFLVVAATLLEIKSNSVLPNFEEDITIEDTPKQRFISMLEEYKLLKEAGQELKEHENLHRYYRQRDERVNDTRVALIDFTMENLVEAFTKVFLRFERERARNDEKEIMKDPFTVEEKVEFLKKLIAERHEINFFEIFEGDYNRFEVITTFQALLEILKEQVATAIQEEAFGDILIKEKVS